MYRAIRGFEGDEVYRYTSSLSHDKNIYRQVLLVISAHAIHLHRKGLIPSSARRILRALLGLWRSSAREVLRGGYEDLFEAIETMLTREAGDEAGWIWIGRSRNDHIAAALRLYTLEKGLALLLKLSRVRMKVLHKAREYTDTPVPGFTHGQPSQVLTGSCLLIAYEEALAGVQDLIAASLRDSWKSPLGAAAGAGSMAPIDEGGLAESLGFQEIYSSPYYASGSRLFLEAFLAALAVFGVEASRIAEDLMAYKSLRIIQLPSSHIATSSIMPHKENPVTLEIARSVASRIQGLAFTGLLVPLKLRYSYNLDLQEANPILYSIAGDALLLADILDSVFDSLKLDGQAALRMITRYKPWSSELAESIALRDGIPLRKAYSLVASVVGDKGFDDLTQRHDVSPERLASTRMTGCSKNRITRILEEREAKAMEDLKEAKRMYRGLMSSYGRVARMLLDLASQ